MDLPGLFLFLQPFVVVFFNTILDSVSIRKDPSGQTFGMQRAIVGGVNQTNDRINKLKQEKNMATLIWLLVSQMSFQVKCCGKRIQKKSNDSFSFRPTLKISIMHLAYRYKG